MQRPKQLTITASGKSNPVPLDYYVNGYALSVTMKTAGAVYTLKYCMDDPFGTYSTSYNVSGTWFDWDDATLVKASANKSTNLAFPARAVRVSAISKVSAGNPLTFTIIAMGAM